MSSNSRPSSIVAGAALLVVGSLGSFPLLIPGDGPPPAITVAGIVLGLLMLLAAYGVWQRRRWGMVVGLIATAINGLTTLPGVFFASAIGWQILCVFGVIVAVATLVLLLMPTSRRVYA